MENKKVNYDNRFTSRTKEHSKDTTCFSKEYIGEWLLFSCFLILLIVITCFHEITYDEAQAWLIARDASFRDLLLLIPHYEGHPPLWHFILAVMAKCQVPPHIGLHIPTIFFSAGAVWLILFRSPFPKYVRFVLPFTYYIFYRYSVVARPYCISMLGFMLAAMFYRTKEEHPIRFCLALLLLCSSNAFGMVFAAGICIVWLVELLTDKVKRRQMKWISAAISLSCLVVINLLQLILIIPKSDTNAVGNYSSKVFIDSFLYMIVIAPADSMFLDSGMDARLQDYAERILYTGSFFWIYWIIGLLTLAVLIVFAVKKRKLLLFMIPYFMFSLFAAKVYFWYHHIGLVYLFLVFFCWCACDSKEVSDAIVEDKKEWINEKVGKMLATLAFFLGLMVSVAWNLYDCCLDVGKPIWYTANLAEGIRSVGADQNNCVLQWNYYPIKDVSDPVEAANPANYAYSPSITCFFDCLVYFDKNIFYNHNEGIKEISYNRQILYDAGREDALMDKMALKGYPEFIVGNSIVLRTIPINEATPNYVPVYRFEVWKPDKFMVDHNDQFIYAREDIYITRTDWPIREQMKIR